MLNLLRRYIAGGMFVLFMMQILISCATFFLIEQNRYSQMVKIVNGRSPTETLLLSQNELKEAYTTHTNELHWKDMYYDICSTVKTNGGYCIKVLADKKEKELHRIAKKYPHKGTHKLSCVKQLSVFLGTENNLHTIEFRAADKKDAYGSAYLMWKKMIYFKISAPPPDRC